MKKLTVLMICLSIILLFTSVSGQSIAKYVKHLENVYNIIVKYNFNTDVAASQVKAYTDEHKTEIEAVLKELATSTTKETQSQYDKVIKYINKIKAYIIKDMVCYPASTAKEIKAMIDQNQADIDKRIEEFNAGNEFFLKKIFIETALHLEIINQFRQTTPVTSYRIIKNPVFLEAAAVLKIDNLLQE